MKLLFKTNTDNAKTVADTNFKDHYPQVNKNTEWQPIAKMIKQVTKSYVIPFITAELYADLADKYHEDADEMSDKEKELLETLQDAIAEYTVWKISPRINITVADFGVREEAGDRGTSNPAEAWRYKVAMFAVMLDADKHIDEALKYLQDNSADFEEFNLNRAKLLVNDCFLPNTSAVQQHIDISNSPRTFRKLIPSILRAQRKNILVLLGKEQYDDLITKIRTNAELTEVEQGLLAIVSECTALHAFTRALPSMSCKIENGSVFTVSDIDGMNTKQTAHLKTIEFLMNQTESDAQAAETHLLAYLYEYKEDLPIWAESLAKERQDNRENFPRTFGHGAVFL